MNISKKNVLAGMFLSLLIILLSLCLVAFPEAAYATTLSSQGENSERSNAARSASAGSTTATASIRAAAAALSASSSSYADTFGEHLLEKFSIVEEGAYETNGETEVDDDAVVNYSIPIVTYMLSALSEPAYALLNSLTGTLYIDSEGNNAYVDGSTTVSAVDESTTELTDGWWLVSGEVTITSQITVAGNVHLILGEGSHLNATKGITVNGDNSLTIYAQSTNTSTMGKLTATGGHWAAGIGGDEGNSSGAITINGGSITATGGYDGAGIGGGTDGGANITINGGNITATGGGDEWGGGAGIGGGYTWENDVAIDIKITGGTIYATGSAGAAGIGSGYGYDQDNHTINIDIDGGNVTAQSSSDKVDEAGGGAGIGGGAWHSGEINITIDNATIIATGGGYYWGGGAGIGGGADGDANITINGGNITATGGGDELVAGAGGAGIGGGCYGDANITINGGNVTATGGFDGAGIGGGYYGGANITINGGNVTAVGGDWAAGIGGGYTWENDVTIDIKITGGTIYATGSAGAAGIGSGYGHNQDNHTINIDIDGGNITAQSLSDKVNGDSGAGIGGGAWHSGEINITIDNATIIATGGGSYYGGGAGIGSGGYSNTMLLFITINSGNITATSAGGSDYYGGGAGIGSGAYSGFYTGTETIIMVNNGNITAIGGEYAAGIGGGDCSFDDTISITIGGGTITAVGNDDANDIGHAYYGYSDATIVISNGSVKANTLSTTPMDGESNFVYLYELENMSGVDEVTVDNNRTYYRDGDHGDDGTFYLYLTGEAHTITVGDNEYNVAWNVNFHLSVENVTGGNIAVTDGWSFSDGIITIYEDGNYIITGEGKKNSNHQISVANGINVVITLVDVWFTNKFASAMSIDSTANVTLILEGESTFSTTAVYYAGISFGNTTSSNNTGSLTINSTNNGSLTATGGDYAAGIGGDYGCTSGTITINGGSITATGGYEGAGIGGGYYGSGNNITINGGTVIATGGRYAAGIGGGYCGSGNNITINGGTVIAVGGDWAAGIGGGEYGSANNIAITGGNVTATGYCGGAGIGGGYYGSGNNIAITGGTVTAASDNINSGLVGDDIGGGEGYYASASNITISGGSVKLAHDRISATLTDNDDNELYLYVISDMSGVNEVTVDGVTYYRDGDHGDDGAFYLYLTRRTHTIEIGETVSTISWDGMSYGCLSIENITTGGNVGATDGWSFNDDFSIIISSSGSYKVTDTCGGIHSGYQIYIDDDLEVELTIENVKIINAYTAAMYIGSSTVTLNFIGDNLFNTGGAYYAGIHYSNTDANKSLTIASESEENTLIVRGGSYAAGIGGGDVTNIEITSGTIIAYGGYGGAGIGSGWYASASNITITGGNITATGGYYGAGIGTGEGYYGGTYGATNIIISGGTITASGGHGAAGIGSGFDSYARNIKITGGTITAIGGTSGAGIGTGGACFTDYIYVDGITIEDGTIYATGGGSVASIFYGAAGIGGGTKTTADNITISGGIITIEAPEGVAVGDSYSSNSSPCSQSSQNIKINYGVPGYWWRNSSSDAFNLQYTDLEEEYYVQKYLQLYPTTTIEYVLLSEENPSDASETPEKVVGRVTDTYTIEDELTTNENTSTSVWTFTGWYYDEELTEEASGDITLTYESVTLYGEWQQSSISLDKTVSGTVSNAVAGTTTITYLFTVTNTGETTVNNITVYDEELDVSIALNKTTLTPNEIATGSYQYTVTQADIDAGEIYNSATATGYTPSGAPVTNCDYETTIITQNPSISLTKVADDGTVLSNAKAGDWVYYTLTATNTGNTTLYDVAITDELDGVETVSGSSYAVSLPPNGILVLRVKYQLTQDDITAGEVYNPASVISTDPKGNNVTNNASETVTTPATPSISLSKTANIDSIGYALPGDTITYLFEITNTGNTTITDLTLYDELLGGDITASLDVTIIEPGGVATAIVSYLLTEDDVRNGSVVNMASAAGKDPDGEDITAEDKCTVELPTAPSLIVTKTVRAAADDMADEDLTVDDVLIYTLVVANNGNQTLTDVTLYDELLGGYINLTDAVKGIDMTVIGSSDVNGAEGERAYYTEHTEISEDDPITTLRPGEYLIIEVSYTLTQDDLNNGRVDNTAITTGIAPDGSGVAGEDTAVMYLPQHPSIELLKEASLETLTAARADDIVYYTFTITNTGDVSLTNITLTDDLDGVIVDTSSIDGLVLAPGEMVVVAAEYALTDADIQAGNVYNHATVWAESVVPSDDGNIWSGAQQVSNDDDAIIEGIIAAAVADELILSQTGENIFLMLASVCVGLIATASAVAGYVSKQRRTK